MISNIFLKKNFVLITGLCLPVLLVLVFLLANHLPRINNDPPQYEMIFSVQRYNNQTSFHVDFLIRDRKLYMRLNPKKDSYGNGDKDLFVYNGQKESIRKISYLPIMNQSIDTPIELPIDQLDSYMIDNNSKAPDGYELETHRTYSRGILGEIFSHRRPENRVKKSGGNSYVIPAYSSDYTYGRISFIGWIIDSE